MRDDVILKPPSDCRGRILPLGRLRTWFCARRELWTFFLRPSQLTFTRKEKTASTSFGVSTGYVAEHFDAPNLLILGRERDRRDPRKTSARKCPTNFISRNDEWNTPTILLVTRIATYRIVSYRIVSPTPEWSPRYSFCLAQKSVLHRTIQKTSLRLSLLILIILFIVVFIVLLCRRQVELHSLAIWRIKLSTLPWHRCCVEFFVCLFLFVHIFFFH